MKSYKLKKGTIVKIDEHYYSPAFGYSIAFWDDIERIHTTLDEDVVVSCSEVGKYPIEDRAKDKMIRALVKKYNLPALTGQKAWYRVRVGNDEGHLGKFKRVWEEVK